MSIVNNEEKKWYAIYTKPRWEKKVAELLSSKNIDNYCPLNKVRKKWSDRNKIVSMPLFPSYVFVHINKQDILPLKNTHGVLNLVYWLGKPAEIRTVEIELIKRFMNEHENVSVEKLKVNLNDRIKITGGPFLEHTGHVKEIKKRTVKIVLSSLGYVMIAEVQKANIELTYPLHSGLEIQSEEQNIRIAN
jgi:transcription antitermination factor NusG